MKGGMRKEKEYAVLICTSFNHPDMHRRTSGQVGTVCRLMEKGIRRAASDDMCVRRGGKLNGDPK